MELPEKADLDRNYTAWDKCFSQVSGVCQGLGIKNQAKDSQAEVLLEVSNVQYAANSSPQVSTIFLQISPQSPKCPPLFVKRTQE